MIGIQPQYLTLNQLLTGRLFRIPGYQRAYSWGPKQREDLFGDIAKIADSNDDDIHFMATIVGLRREKREIMTDVHQIIEVVDGQQRLTTLILLLKALAQALDGSDATQHRTRNELDETLVKPDKFSLLLLQTNHDSSHYFADYLRCGNHPSSDVAISLADRALLEAIEECERYVKDWLGEGRNLLSLISLLKNRLTFVFHEIEDEAAVYTVFEVLNSRGLDVSWFDRLKSMLMGIAFERATGNEAEVAEELHHLWRDIYATVGLRQGMSTEAMRFAATLRLPARPNRPSGQQDAAQTLRDQSQDRPPVVLETTKWIKSVTEAVDRLWADRRRNAVRRIAHARLVVTALYLRQDLSASEVDAVLRRWENVTFRIYGMLGKDARTRVGDYVRLAWRIHNEKLLVPEILGQLEAIGSAFPIDQAIDNLRGTDCYTDWQEELRYLFFRYEEHLSHEAGHNFDNEQWNRIWLASAADSVEHILPQSKGPEQLVHRLGNLLLLPPKLNSKLGARNPSEKKSDYEHTGLLIAHDVAESLAGWDEDAIQARENKLLEWAQREWAD